MTTTPPRRLAPGERRRQILDTARQLLDVKHLVEITVEEAARRAGVSPGLVFHYFGSQIGFRRALAEEAARELLGQLAPDPAYSHAEQLRGALDRFALYAAGHPRLYVAVTSDANADAREVHQGIVGTVAGWITGIMADIGVPVTPTLTAAVSGWIAFTEKVVAGWLAAPGLTREEVVDLCAKTCYHVFQVIVDDPEQWRRIEAALAAKPGAAKPDPAKPGAAKPGPVEPGFTG